MAFDEVQPPGVVDSQSVGLTIEHRVTLPPSPADAADSRPAELFHCRLGPLQSALAGSVASPVATGARKPLREAALPAPRRRPCTWSTTPTRTSVDFEFPAGVSRR